MRDRGHLAGIAVVEWHPGGLRDLLLADTGIAADALAVLLRHLRTQGALGANL